MPVAWVGLAGTAIGAATSAYGAISSGNAAAASANYKAAVARNNAVISGQNAATALTQGQDAAGAVMVQGSQKMSSLRAGLGASGVALNSGSAVDTQRSLGAATAFSAENEDYKAYIKSQSYLAQGQSDSAQGVLATAEAANDKTAGDIGAFSSLASGASTVASRYTTFKQNGVGVGSGLGY